MFEPGELTMAKPSRGRLQRAGECCDVLVAVSGTVSVRLSVCLYLSLCLFSMRV